jgi:hypothetical protein
MYPSSAAASSSVLARTLGRPRTALVLGGSNEAILDEATSVHEAKDARVDRRDADQEVLTKLEKDKKTYDLVVLTAGALAGPLASSPDRFARLLTDGGHVAVLGPAANGHGLSAARSRLEAPAEVLRGAGLDVMRLDPGGAPLHVRAVRLAHARLAKVPPPAFDASVVIARRAPKPGKLSLTIGMLSLNEEKSMEKMILEIRAVAPDAKILVIDSSSDQTPEIATRLGARVVRQLPPRGHGPAMERLMYEASKESDALIYLDCDFTYPTHAIPRIRQLLEEGADLVNATRTHHYPKEMPVPNFLANRLFAASAHAVHGVPTTDVHSGMRGYRASMVRAFDFSGEGDALPLDTLILPAKTNYHVAELPIPYLERVGDSKLAKVRGTVWTFLRIAGMVGEGKRVRRDRRYRHIAS